MDSIIISSAIIIVGLNIIWVLKDILEELKNGRP